MVGHCVVVSSPVRAVGRGGVGGPVSMTVTLASPGVWVFLSAPTNKGSEKSGYSEIICKKGHIFHRF